MGVLLWVMLGATPAVGDVAPDFVAVDTEGHAHRLSKMLANGPVVVVFFPRAFTPD